MCILCAQGTHQPRVLTWVFAVVVFADLAKSKGQADSKAKTEEAQGKEAKVEEDEKQDRILDVHDGPAIETVEGTHESDIGAAMQLTLDMDFEEIRGVEKEKAFRGIFA